MLRMKLKSCLRTYLFCSLFECLSLILNDVRNSSGSAVKLSRRIWFSFWVTFESDQCSKLCISYHLLLSISFLSRYGDKTPKSISGRLFSVVWIITGITVCSILTATLSSALTNVTVSVERYDVTTGKTVSSRLEIICGFYVSVIVFRELFG